MVIVVQLEFATQFFPHYLYSIPLWFFHFISYLSFSASSFYLCLFLSLSSSLSCASLLMIERLVRLICALWLFWLLSLLLFLCLSIFLQIEKEMIDEVDVSLNTLTDEMPLSPSIENVFSLIHCLFVFFIFIFYLEDP